MGEIVETNVTISYGINDTLTIDTLANST
jgi:hypothetical protein